MNWFKAQRLDWIAEMLHVYGFINRFHLMLKFGISDAQATLDFKSFHELHPNQMTYDIRKKAYVAKKP